MVILMDFIHEKSRIYTTDEKGNAIAEVTFPNVTDHVVVINHTFVDPSLRGQGVAGKLMEEAVSHLRNNNLKAQLTCSYAVTWFEQHSECGDVLDK